MSETAPTMHFEDRMSDSDALMWHIEKDPMLRSTITAVAVLDSTPDREMLAEKMERGTRLIPRLRQRVVGNPYSLAPPRWEVDPHFDMRFHLRWVDLGGSGTMRDVLDMAEPMAMQGFDRARPLWETVVVQGLDDGRSAVIQKLHHAITDGVGGMQMMMVLLDLERDPASSSDPMPDAPVAAPMDAQERFNDALGHVFRRNVGIAQRLPEMIGKAVVALASDPASAMAGVTETASSVGRTLSTSSEPLSPIMTGRSLSVRFETLSFSLPELKAAAKKADGRLNDAFVAGVAGGMRRYHEHHGAEISSLRMNMPISVRTEDSQNVVGNQFAPARFAVPCDIKDPVEAMRTVQSLVAGQRAEPALNLLAPLSGVINRLPTTLTTALFGSMAKGVDFTTSNVPGAPIPVYMGRAQLETMIPFGPLAGAAVNITLVSNLETVFLGINCDTAAVPDADVLRDCLQDSFDEILKLG